MRLCLVIITLTILGTLLGSAREQAPAPQSGSIQLSRFGDLLREHHID